MTDTLLLILVFAPFVWGVLCPLTPKRLHSSLGLFSAGGAFALFLMVCDLTFRLSDVKAYALLIPWVPAAYLNVSLLADGLSLFFCFLITGMGTLVFVYANYFMDSKDQRIGYFYCYLNIFMGAMVGAVLADNFMLLFLFWELTSVMSFMLISYHSEEAKARAAARTAFLVTSLAGLCLMLGFVLIAVLDNTLEISVAAEQGLLEEKHPFWIFTIMFLILVGIYAKSAQFPLHFWLPQAMTAPTPVSAYLHSATMVKLGIYLLARIYVMFVESSLWFPLVTTLSLATILVGGICALYETSLKKILAYATVSQLGFFISFYGIGDPQGLEYDYVHIFNHALYKGSLFMLVGVLAHATGVYSIDKLGGMVKKLPLWGGIFTLSIAAMAGIPGTTGFLSKELLLKDMLIFAEEEPAGVVVFTVLCLGLLIKVAFSYRLIHYLYFTNGGEDVEVKSSPTTLLLLSPFILSTLALVLGVWPQGLEMLSRTYYIEGLHKEGSSELLLWHGVTLNLLLSLAMFVGGVFFFKYTKSHKRVYEKFAAIDLFSSCTYLIEMMPSYAKGITQRIHSVKPESNVAKVFVLFSAVILTLTILEGKRIDFVVTFSLENLIRGLIVLSVVLLLRISSAYCKLITLSLVGFLITLYFVVKQAPDLAMTQMVVEVATLFIFILLFSKLKNHVHRKFSPKRAAIAVAFGLSAALLPAFNGAMLHEVSLAEFFIKSSIPLAKGSNVVNTILVDFRALDTLGEISVISAAVLGVYGMRMRYKATFAGLKRPFIPTPLLSAVMPSIFIITALFSLYLLGRGHNYPGGGFIGGVVVAISFVLLEMSINRSKFPIFNRFNSLVLVFSGLAIALASSLFSLTLGDGFMAAYFLPKSPILSTPFIFDVGVFILVTGSIMKLVHTMRINTLEDIL